MRCAAILACGRKKAKTLVPDLIALLDDTDPEDCALIVLIEEVLRGLTGARQEVAEGWKTWWEEHAPE